MTSSDAEPDERAGEVADDADRAEDGGEEGDSGGGLSEGGRCAGGTADEVPFEVGAGE